ncbi:hypothetical protein ACQ3I4_00565 [Zafaria sp. Z1313]|uniref:hypothetical protein n=1 Tax=Zafaria sp. Z1313 TaxID=3423202 RepID=UPI003D302AC1
MGGGLLICYSVTFPRAADPAPLLRQLTTSLSSLRRHNARAEVVVFVHSGAPEALGALCRGHDAALVARGGYRERLAADCPEGAAVLARYPALHKFLNYDWITARGPEQVLCCDCDTVFLADPAPWCVAYQGAHLVAREEVCTRRSHHPADPAFLDEPAYDALAAALGFAPVAPFNTGVVLLNHGAWAALAATRGWFLDCAWRLLLGMSEDPGRFAGTGFGTLEGFRAARHLAGPRTAALPFPSANQWILEEVATWLAVGALASVACAHFAPEHVAQNGEFAATDPDTAGWFLCHYYSGNQDAVHAWLAGQPAGVG